MIYRFKASIHKQKDFLREYELRGDHTLYDLHEHIQNDLAFAPDQMVTFYVTDAQQKIKKEYGLFDMGNGSMDQQYIETLIERKETHFLYVFDTFNNRALHIVFLGADEEASRKTYPRTTLEKGMPPDQFSDKTDVFDETMGDDYEIENIADHFDDE